MPNEVNSLYRTGNTITYASLKNLPTGSIVEKVDYPYNQPYRRYLVLYMPGEEHRQLEAHEVMERYMNDQAVWFMSEDQGIRRPYSLKELCKLIANDTIFHTSFEDCRDRLKILSKASALVEKELNNGN